MPTVATPVTFAFLAVISSSVMSPLKVTSLVNDEIPETLRELQYLQEDIAAYFTDEHVVSGETYWTCVESVAIAKLAELRGEPLYYEKLKEILDAMITSEDEEE